MSIDLTKLTPAPWVYDERTGIASVFAGTPPDCLLSHNLPRCIASKSASWSPIGTGGLIAGWTWNEADLADMEFIALARNAFDVMMRRSWTYGIDRNERIYIWDARGYDVEGLPDREWGSNPFTALVEAEKWYREHIDNSQERFTPSSPNTEERDT